MGEWGVGRRQAALGALAGGLALLNATQAQAFLGIGEPSQEEVYKADTVLPPLHPAHTALMSGACPGCVKGVSS